MKTIDTQFITASAEQTFIKATFDHLQAAYKELFAGIGNFLKIDDYSSSVPYILSGCSYSDNGTNWTVTAGVIYFGGEFYLVPAVTKAIVGGQTRVLKYTTTYDPADPTPFTDGTTHNVHKIVTIAVDNGVSGTGDADYSACVRLNSPQVGIKSALTWTTLTNTTINFETSQRLFYGSDPGGNAGIVFKFENPAIGCIKHIYATISAMGQIGFSTSPVILYVKYANGTMGTIDLSGGGNAIVFTNSGKFCLELEYMGIISAKHQISVTVSGT